MKQAQNARQQRGRPSSRQGGKSNRGPGNHRNEQQIRGNPKQLVEKYKNQARECLQAGDRMQAEYYFQFAEHYYRVLNEARNNAPNQGDRDNQQHNNQQQNSRRQRAQNGDGSGAGDQQGEHSQRRGRRGRSRDDKQNPPNAEKQADTPQTNGAVGEKGNAAAVANSDNGQAGDVQPSTQVATDAAKQAQNDQPAIQDTPKEASVGAPKDTVAKRELSEAPPKPARRRVPRKRAAPVEEKDAAAPLDPTTSDLT